MCGGESVCITNGKENLMLRVNGTALPVSSKLQIPSLFYSKESEPTCVLP